MSVYEVTGRDSDQSDAAKATTKDRRRRLFNIDSEATEKDAKRALINFAPPEVDGLLANRYRVNEIGYQEWEGEVEYEPVELSVEASSLRTGEWRIRVSSGQATAHVTHGELLSSSANRSLPTTLQSNFFGAINVSMEEPDRPSVEGIDVPVGTLSMSVTIAKAGAEVASATFWKDIQRMNGYVNPSAFLGFDRGEVIFRGATAEVSDAQLGPLAAQDPIEISYEFEMSENLYDFPIGQNPFDGTPQVVVPFKGGWDVLSVITQPWADITALTMYPAIVQADVIRVAYESPIDFNRIWR